MKELYDSRITDPSLKELEELAAWYNEKLGNYPVIVGGWAAYFYARGLGSKDIDVVFPDEKSKHATLSAYFASHGYTEHRRDFFDKEFTKTVAAGEKNVDVIIDAVSAKRFITVEGKSFRIPWSWAATHNIEHAVGSARIRIPKLELLLAYKLGAVVGRNAYLKTGIDFEYYRSKLWKDVYDVLSLAELNANAKQLEKFLAEAGLDKYETEMMQTIEDNYDAELRSLLKNVSLSNIRKLITNNETTK